MSHLTHHQARQFYEWELHHGRFRPGDHHYRPPPPGYLHDWRRVYHRHHGRHFDEQRRRSPSPPPPPRRRIGDDSNGTAHVEEPDDAESDISNDDSTPAPAYPSKADLLALMQLTDRMGLPGLDAEVASRLDDYAGLEINKEVHSEELERYLLQSIKALLVLHLGASLHERDLLKFWRRCMGDQQSSMPNLRNEIVAEYTDARGGLQHRLSSEFWCRMLDCVSLPPHGISNHPTVYFLTEIGETHTFEMPMFHAFCHRMQTHKMVALPNVFRLLCSISLIHKNLEQVLHDSHWISSNNGGAAGVWCELHDFAHSFPPGLLRKGDPICGGCNDADDCSRDTDEPSLGEEVRRDLWIKECSRLINLLQLDTSSYTDTYLASAAVSEVQE